MRASDEQRHAIEYSLTSEPFFSTDGPAGTGKTWIMDEVYWSWVKDGYRVAVCSPTAKAAKNIGERTGIKVARTIHRLLEFPLPVELAEKDEYGRPKLLSRGPKRNADMPLEYDVVLADEYSMPNWEIHGQLLDAMPRGAVLRPFGDLHQLAPIEPKESDPNRPSPFKTLLKRHPSVRLTHSWRNQGDILKNANRILSGEPLIDGGDFALIVTPRVQEALFDWIDFERTAGRNYLADPACQIITPSNKYEIGTAALNLLIMKRLIVEAPHGWWYPPRHYWDKTSQVMFNIGIKVVQVKNDYDTGVMNGETGTIIQRNDDESIDVDLGDRIVRYKEKIDVLTPDGFVRPVYPQANLELGWVLTTHKTQGSQYKHVVYVMDYAARGSHRVSNFYTGVTRTQETCTVITDDRALHNSLVNV